jgi:hypothetical protein
VFISVVQTGEEQAAFIESQQESGGKSRSLAGSFPLRVKGYA